MGDTDIVGEDYDFFYDDDWLYIEDEFAVADELAETQIPSPGYSGTNAELMHEWYEYDTYDYFGELEYGDDAFWDVALIQTKQEHAQSGKQKPRKRKRAASKPHTEKRRKLQGQYEDPEIDPKWQTVVYRQTTPLAKSVPAVNDKTVSFALFPDWRRRFPIDADMEWHTSMPEDMKRAAQADVTIEEQQDQGRDDDNNFELEVETTPKAIEQPVRRNKKRQTTRVSPQAADPEGTSAHDPEPALDLEAVRTILKSKLGNVGLDEEAFMSVISNMLAGGGTADDAIAQLANTLLDQRDDDNNAAMSWLQDNGVNVAATAEEETSKGRRVDSGAEFPDEATPARQSVSSKTQGEHLPDDSHHHTEQGHKDPRTGRHSGGKR